MFTKRIIPCLDVLRGEVVKGVHFQTLRYAGDPPSRAAVYEAQGADEIVFLDIGASPQRAQTLIDVIRRTAEQVFIPLTVGGGIKSVEEMEAILEAGADKVSLNTAAVENPNLVRVGAERFGSQCIVIAVDAKRLPQGGWEVYTMGGRKPTGLDALQWVRRVEALGAGELLVTSMDADGTRTGYDLELTRAVAEAVGIPVIASGGAGDPEHIYQALTLGKADAALAASIFHYGQYSVAQVKRELLGRGVPVRPPMG